MMMGGSKMSIEIDSGKGQEVGSHIKMSGKILGVYLYLDEVVSVHTPPNKKEWKTVGDIRLIVIGHYVLGFEVVQQEHGTVFKTYIDYELPASPLGKLCGILFGKWYAKWCVEQMVSSVAHTFGGFAK